MNEHIERIMRDIKESLEQLYAHAYEAGKDEQERVDIVEIQEAYDKGVDAGYAEGERDGYRVGKQEVKY